MHFLTRVTQITDNGQAALDMIEQGHEFDLILMDISMRVMDGIEATQHLRQNGVDTPIIALTAHSMLEDKNKCLLAGMNDLIIKPIRTEHMNHMLTKYLD